MYKRTRAAGFGPEVQRRIMLGTYVLRSGYYDAYYRRASQVRTLVARDFAAAFTKCDVLMTPTSPVLPFRLGERLCDPLSMYLADIYTISCNLAGLPGLSMPCGLVTEAGSNRPLPVGVQLLGPPLHDAKVLQVAAAYQRHRLAQAATSDPDSATARRRPVAMTAATEFEPVIGLEVHVQLATSSKAFCGAQAEFGGPPNTHIDPYTLGLPGALPVLNHRAVEFALRMGLACRL
jgi:hypothetical protein